MKKIQSISMMFILVALFLFTNNVYGWESPVTVTSSNVYNYKNIATRIEQETGHVYIVYKRRDSGKQISDIFIRKYDGKKITVLGDNDGNVSSSPSQESYSPHVQIKNGIVHVAWTEHPKDNDHAHKIKYRNFNGKEWSKIYDLGGGISGGEVEDLHMDVDDNGNVFVVFMDWGPVVCKLVYKIGNKVGNKLFPMGGRQKHPDIAVSGDTIYVSYQWRAGGLKYYLGTAQIKTTSTAEWTNAKALVSNHDVARPRITVDDNGYPNYFYYDEYGTGSRTPWHFKWDGSQFTRGYQMLSEKTYHFADIATRGGSILHAAQLGVTTGGYAIRYNWKQNTGGWTGGLNLPGVSSPMSMALDLSADGTAAAIVYGTPSSVKLIVSGEIKGGGGFETDFTVNSSPVFYETAVIFDASITEIPENETVKTYTWDFGDGEIESISAPTISHTYKVFRENVEVKLTIETENGMTGIGYKTINIKAPYTAILDGSPSKIEVKTLIYNRTGYKIKWNSNPNNQNDGYQISKYQVWRALQSGTYPPNDPADYSFVTEVPSSTYVFVDYSDNIDGNYNYYYIIRAVDLDGHISPLFD